MLTPPLPAAETRSAKPFSRQAYEHGVVIVQCPSCRARHLLADRLGWFGEAGSIEDVLADKGESAPSALPHPPVFISRIRPVPAPLTLTGPLGTSLFMHRLLVPEGIHVQACMLGLQ